VATTKVFGSSVALCLTADPFSMFKLLIPVVALSTLAGCATWARFSTDARDYVSHIDPRVVLIDGRELAEYMLDLDLGGYSAATAFTQAITVKTILMRKNTMPLLKNSQRKSINHCNAMLRCSGATLASFTPRG
jgi:hypothetical protein